jgi:predicted hydrocarbon binding protein
MESIGKKGEQTMPFRLDRLLNSVELLIDEKVAKKIEKECADAAKKATTASKKAELIACLMEKLDKNVTKNFAQKTMESCGRKCIAKSTIKRALKLYQQSKDLEDFLSKLNQTGIGGGHLKRKGTQITARYIQCYCGWVSGSEGPIPMTYCFCSAGWYKELFEKTLGKPVEVTILQSIASGAKDCRFIIDI